MRRGVIVASVTLTGVRTRRWFALIMGSAVTPLVIANALSGEVSVALKLVPITLLPWLVAGWVRPRWSWVALTVLSALLAWTSVASAGVTDDPITWGSLFLFQYVVTFILGVLVLVAAIRRHTEGPAESPDGPWEAYVDWSPRRPDGDPTTDDEGADLRG